MRFFFQMPLFLATLVLWNGCSSSPTPLTDTEAQSISQNEVVDPSPVEGQGETLDLPSSGAIPRLKSENLQVLGSPVEGLPQVKKITRKLPGQKTPILVRLEFDLNQDGRVDFIQEFDPTGEWIEKESADLNGDGAVETLNVYRKTLASKDPQLLTQEIKNPKSGITQVWKFYENGKLVRREISRKNTGKPDYWEYFASEKLQKISKDDDGDGQPDEFSGFKPVSVPKGPEPRKPKAAVR